MTTEMNRSDRVRRLRQIVARCDGHVGVHTDDLRAVLSLVDELQGELPRDEEEPVDRERNG